MWCVMSRKRLVVNLDWLDPPPVHGRRDLVKIPHMTINIDTQSRRIYKYRGKGFMAVGRGSGPHLIHSTVLLVWCDASKLVPNQGQYSHIPTNTDATLASKVVFTTEQKHPPHRVFDRFVFFFVDEVRFKKK